jgi:hypothetical protein
MGSRSDRSEFAMARWPKLECARSWRFWSEQFETLNSSRFRKMCLKRVQLGPHRCVRVAKGRGDQPRNDRGALGDFGPPRDSARNRRRRAPWDARSGLAGGITPPARPDAYWAPWRGCSGVKPHQTNDLALRAPPGRFRGIGARPRRFRTHQTPRNAKKTSCEAGKRAVRMASS